MRVACLKLSKPEKVEAIADAFFRFSPQISIRKDGVIFLEIGKCKKLYSEPSFLARADVLLRRFDVQASFGIGSSIPEALAVSMYQTNVQGELPISFLAEYVDPFYVSESSRASVRRILEVMPSLGVRSLLDFTQIPGAQLTSRFGAIGLLARQRTEDPGSIHWLEWTPPEKIIEERDLRGEEECRTLEPLLFELKGHLDRIFSRLKGRGRRLARLRIDLSLDRKREGVREKREWDVEFLLPQGAALGTVTVLRERLGRDFDRTPLGAPVVGVRLEVLEHVAGFDSQREFFQEDSNVEEDRNALLSFIAESVGRENVFQAHLKEERLPELSWEKARVKSPQKIDLSRLPPRPSRMLGKPERIEVTEGKVFLGSKSFPIIEWSEVERVSSRWLDQFERRDYYKIDIENGCPLWVFMDTDGRTFLHGYFV